MKINEACKRTGLSERAIRFYVEKGLLTPKSQIINGRTTTEYSEEDIELLRDIAALRNAEFSIADILAMQSSDEDVCRIIQKHCAELEQEQMLRDDLLKELKEISRRDAISWRKLSAILAQKRDDYQWQGMRIPEEESEVYETDKNSIWNRMKRVVKWGVLVFFIALVIFVFAYDKHNTGERFDMSMGMLSIQGSRNKMTKYTYQGMILKSQTIRKKRFNINCELLEQNLNLLVLSQVIWK